MRKNKFLSTCCLGFGLLVSAYARAGWVEDVCADHPKREYCIATICEKAAGQCSRSAGSGSTAGGPYAFKLYSNQNSGGSHKHEAPWRESGAVTDRSGENKSKKASMMDARDYPERRSDAAEASKMMESRMLRETPASMPSSR